MKRNRLAGLVATKRADLWLGILACLFGLFGLLMIYDASNVIAFRDFGDKYHYMREQSVWLGIGVVVLFIVARIPYTVYYGLSVPMMLAAIGFLLAVFIPGIGISTLGASRWISIGPVNFQPSEFAKLAVILYLSSWLSHPERKRLGSFLLLFCLIIGLVVLQPDLGTATILSAIFVMLYFLSGSPWWHIAALVPLLIGGVMVLAVAAPYRWARLTTFFNPNLDPLGSSYHVRQILLSLGSGGMWGMGLGASKQKYQFLPEAATDSIFAILAEELGFVGSALFVIFCLAFLQRILSVVVKAPDRQSFLLSGGILAYFGFQMIINLGSMTTLFPLTGVPLPFISYGGSSLMIAFVAVGILLNISKNSHS